MMNEAMNITLYHYLFLALILFFIGLWGAIVVKNIIKMLICIEFMLTGINLNFIAFSRYIENTDGNTFVLFYTATGAIELAVALYIFYLMYKKKSTPDTEELNKKENI